MMIDLCVFVSIIISMGKYSISTCLQAYTRVLIPHTQSVLIIINASISKTPDTPITSLHLVINYL